VKARDALTACAALLAGLVLGACSGSRAVRQADGRYRMHCTGNLGGCAHRAGAVCGDEGYQILEGFQRPRVYGAPDGEQVAVDRSEIVFRCGSAEAEETLPTTRPPPPAPKRATRRKTKPPAPRPAVCTPGSTQSCVGPGGCTGGQACLESASGFGPCDCGPAPAVDAGAPPDASAAPGDAATTAAESG
jgi:hypothetical protein